MLLHKHLPSIKLKAKIYVVSNSNNLVKLKWIFDLFCQKYALSEIRQKSAQTYVLAKKNMHFTFNK